MPLDFSMMMLISHFPAQSRFPFRPARATSTAGRSQMCCVPERLAILMPPPRYLTCRCSRSRWRRRRSAACKRARRSDRAFTRRWRARSHASVPQCPLSPRLSSSTTRRAGDDGNKVTSPLAAYRRFFGRSSHFVAEVSILKLMSKNFKVGAQGQHAAHASSSISKLRRSVASCGERDDGSAAAEGRGRHVILTLRAPLLSRVTYYYTYYFTAHFVVAECPRS